MDVFLWEKDREKEMVFVYVREREKKNEKVCLTAESLWDIVLVDKALCYKTQGQTIVFKNDIYTLLPNAGQHTQKM